MIKQEEVKINDKTLIRTYSDSGKFIIQTGTNIKYEEAVDIPNKYSYIESAEDIKPKVVEEEIKKE
jgi:hypothetical protein|nr:MAG TPA: hypothetical protein [Caudoviricetes sp.]